MATDRSLLGERIRAARERLGRNRNQMARDLGTSWQHVDRWERGITRPSPESLQKLAGYLGVSVDHLLGAEPAAAAGPASEPGEGFAQFVTSYAPRDVTEAELEWLRAAPVDHAALGPGDYVNMLHGLRSSAAQSERPPPARSGRQRKVEWSDVIARRKAEGEE